MKSRSNRKPKSRHKARTIRIVRGGGKDISTKRLEIAKSQLIHAQLIANETRISFNFVQRLIAEVLRRRQEEKVLMGEIEELIESVQSDPLCESCDIGCTCGRNSESSICEIDSADLIDEIDDLLLPDDCSALDDSDFLPAFNDTDDIDDYSRLEEAASQGQRLARDDHKKTTRRERPNEDRKSWGWPI